MCGGSFLFSAEIATKTTVLVIENESAVRYTEYRRIREKSCKKAKLYKGEIQMLKKKIACLAAGIVALNTAAMGTFTNNVSVHAASAPYIEQIDRGITAINTGNGMLVSWRFLADDADDAVFELYRNDTLIYTSTAGMATCYLDESGTANDIYRVDTVENGRTSSSDVCYMQSDNDYFKIALDPPKGSVSYVPLESSIGDADGDGQMEFFLKWEPTNAKDNSQKGKTDKVYIDCIKLDGTRLWRIDMGVNIRAGNHYTQMLVADFDSDGYAELCCKTADGTTDAKGNVIGDGSKDYRNSSGYVLSGPEYYSLFDGRTGEVLDTVDYEPARGTVSSWGDKYGNRVDRFLGAVVYLDGVHPSAVTVRGYYTRMAACAYDVVDKKLVKRWYFDTGNNKSAAGYGDGNHNCMPADVDGDGKQELILGATCLDDDGTVLWCTNKGHGDGLHVGDLLPDRDGLEAYMCHEIKPYGVTLVDAKNGKVIFHKDNSSDTGRCCADNVWTGNDGAEFWGIGYDVYDGNGNTLSVNRPGINFLCWWDGDLEREILDYTKITKMNEKGKLDTLLDSSDNCTTDLHSMHEKPVISGDILGDWREEVVWAGTDCKSIYIYCSPYETDARITTMMHDLQYRTQLAGECVTYNMPPHPSFYLGTGESLPERPNVSIVPAGSGVNTVLNGTLIQNLQVLDMQNRADWSIQNGLQNGSYMFGDREVTYAAYPSYLEGAEYIETAADSKASTAALGTFTAGADIAVYVALDNRVTTPAEWLNDWEITGDTIVNSKDVTFNIYRKNFSAGESVTLGTNGQSTGCVNYTVFAIEHIEPINGTLIQNLIVRDSENRADWSIQYGLQTGSYVFGDRDVTYASFPSYLEGAEYILTAADSKAFTADQGSFTAGADMTVYVALDNRVTAPAEWLNDWESTGDTIVNSKDVTFNVYKKNVTAGELVALGTNGQSTGCVNYTIFAAEENGTVEPPVIDDPLIGDVNADGSFGVADVVMLQKWLLGSGMLTNWQAGDLCEDGRLNVFDLCIMKRELLSKS